MDKKKIAIISSIVIALILLVGGVCAVILINGKEITYDNTKSPKYYAFGLPDTTSPTDYQSVITSSGSNVFVQLEGEQLSVCIYRNSTLECFKNNNYEEEIEHIKQVFGDSCNVYSSLIHCPNDDFYCGAYPSGDVGCYDDAAGHDCYLFADGSVYCD